jgi:hypothetical protein
MPGFKRRKRSKQHAPLHEDDDEAIDTVTQMDIEVPTGSGAIKKKRVEVPLISMPRKEPLLHSPMPFEYGANHFPPEPDPVPQGNKCKVRRKGHLW